MNERRRWIDTQRWQPWSWVALDNEVHGREAVHKVGDVTIINAVANTTIVLERMVRKGRHKYRMR